MTEMIVSSPQAERGVGCTAGSSIAIVSRTPLAHLRQSLGCNEDINAETYAANLLSAKPDGYVYTASTETTIIPADPPLATTPCMDQFVPSALQNSPYNVGLLSSSSRVNVIQEEEEQELQDEDHCPSTQRMEDVSDSEGDEEPVLTVDGQYYQGSPVHETNAPRTPNLLPAITLSGDVQEGSPHESWPGSRATASFGRPTPLEDTVLRTHQRNTRTVAYVKAAASSLSTMMGRISKRRKRIVVPPHPAMDEMSCERKFQELQRHYVCLIGLKATELHLAEAQLKALGFKITCRVAMSGNRQYVRLAGPPNERLRLIRRKVLAMLDSHGRKTRMVALSLPQRDVDLLNELWHFKEVSTRDKIIMLRPEDRLVSRWLSPVFRVISEWVNHLSILKALDALIPFPEFSSLIEE